MVNVLLYGKLGKIVGREFSLSCKKLKDIFHAIEQMTGKLKKYFFLNKRRLFAVFVNDQYVSPDEFENFGVKDKTVTIIPILMGGVGTTAVAIALGTTVSAAITAGGVQLAVIFIVGGLINAALALGLSLLLQKIMKPDDNQLQNQSSKSFIFSGAENVSQQGIPVPVGYGRLIVGSRVISANTFNVDFSFFDSEKFYKINNSLNLAESELYESENGGLGFGG